MLDQNEIKKYIRNKVKCEILNIENEKCKEEGKEFIENGIVRLKIKYNLEDHQVLLKDIVGVSKIIGNKVLIQLSGYPPTVKVSIFRQHRTVTVTVPLPSPFQDVLSR